LVSFLINCIVKINFIVNKM